jgi:hypothetical protein
MRLPFGMSATAGGLAAAALSTQLRLEAVPSIGSCAVMGLRDIEVAWLQGKPFNAHLAQPCVFRSHLAFAAEQRVQAFCREVAYRLVFIWTRASPQAKMSPSTEGGTGVQGKMSRCDAKVVK